ncbi:MAG TPA: DNA (cytosine-5-)-methyltransferase [Bacteroidales bacterium]|nr:DNA (cytosine-5-)-methyltransferase [Bacteroidales bacterium]
MTHGSLFSGIGGFDLAAQWAGIENKWQVEWDDYCQKVLKKNFPDVKKYHDITKVNGGELESVDVISGGFPCQPFSQAGKQEGKKDDRYLWPEMLRIIQIVRPTYVIGENVAGIVNMELDTVLFDLETEGYTTETFIIPACAVDALHRRDRVWIIGYTNQNSQSNGSLNEAPDKVVVNSINHSNNTIGKQKSRAEKIPRERRKERCARVFGRTSNDSEVLADSESNRSRGVDIGRIRKQVVRSSKDVSNSNGQGLEGGKKTRNTKSQREETIEQPKRYDNWSTEPDVGRVANGIPSRVDRLKGLGNAIVPQIAYILFCAIKSLDIR